MTDLSNADRDRQRANYALWERQRFEHLVLGRKRAAIEAQSPAPGKRKKRRKIRATETLKHVTLVAGVEERVALRERWSHKKGTPETHEHVDQARRRPGSLARLFESGAIDKDQLAAADQIAEAYRIITADVAVRTASFETRLDGGRHGKAEQEQLGRLYADLAYGWWRDAVGGCADALLEVIAHDVGLTIVARRHCISMPRARRMLTDALYLWSQARRRASRMMDVIAA